MNAWLPIVGPILALVSSVAVAVIVARRGIKSDAIAERAGIATDKISSIGQVMSALESLNDSLQEDNKALRDADRERAAQIATVRAEIADLRKRLEDVESGSSVLRETIREQALEIASLHAENQECRDENEKLMARVVELERINGA